MLLIHSPVTASQFVGPCSPTPRAAVLLTHAPPRMGSGRLRKRAGSSASVFARAAHRTTDDGARSGGSSRKERVGWA
jgi:hypothetical protein